MSSIGSRPASGSASIGGGSPEVMVIGAAFVRSGRGADSCSGAVGGANRANNAISCAQDGKSVLRGQVLSCMWLVNRAGKPIDVGLACCFRQLRGPTFFWLHAADAASVSPIR